MLGEGCAAARCLQCVSELRLSLRAESQRRPRIHTEPGRRVFVGKGGFPDGAGRNARGHRVSYLIRAEERLVSCFSSLYYSALILFSCSYFLCFSLNIGAHCQNPPIISKLLTQQLLTWSLSLPRIEVDFM